MADKKQVLGRAGRVEREQRQTKILLIGSGIVIASIVLVLLVGLFMVSVIQPNQPILEVNGEVIDSQYFQNRVSLTRYTLIQQYSSTFNFMMQFGAENPQLVTQFDQQLQVIEFQLSSSVVGQTTLDQLTDAVLIREAAEEMGIVVSEADIIEEIETNFGYFPNGQPEATATLAIAAESTLSATQIAMVTLTPTFEELTAEADAAGEDTEATPEATAEEASDEEASGEEEAAEETAVEEVPATVEAPPSPTIVPTEEFGLQLEENMAAIADAINADEDVLRDFFTERVYRARVFEIITADVVAEKEMVWARHILVATEEEAIAIYEALQDGADWSEQAAFNSTDQSNNFSGGDLGWFDNTTMVAPFGDAAFAGEVGTITDPVQTDFGWHLIQILGHEMRPLNGEQLEQAKQEAFSAWVAELKTGADITVHEYWSERVPDTPTIDLQILQQVAYIRQQLNAPVGP